MLCPPVMAAASSHACAAQTARIARPLPDGLPAISYERTPGAASLPAPRPYRRCEPEKTAMYALVREHLETLLDEARRSSDSGDGYPAFIERKFRLFLHCGLLSRGFARLRCPSCGFDRLVAFSCKGRICPSCWARRAADTAAHLVDRVLPVAPYRQWVLTFPFESRFLLAVDGAFMTKMLSAFLRTLFAWMRRRARRIGISKGEPGSVTFIQRFGGALNLNPHLHSLVSDGVFGQGHDGRATFVPHTPQVNPALPPQPHHASGQVSNDESLRIAPMDLPTSCPACSPLKSPVSFLWLPGGLHDLHPISLDTEMG